MITIEHIRKTAADPAAQRWLAVIAAVVGFHLVLLVTLASVVPPPWPTPPAPAAAPVYLDISPQVWPVRPQTVPQTARSSARSSSLPPVAVRPAVRSIPPPGVAPLEVDLPPTPVRPRAPGRVIPQSWRDRCNLGDGEVSDAAWRACRDGFLQAAGSTSPPVRGRGDPSQDFAARGAARLRAYESRRAPAPTGNSNAGPSATPGSNFGMGEIDSSVVYVQGQRPETGAD